MFVIIDDMPQTQPSSSNEGGNAKKGKKKKTVETAPVQNVEDLTLTADQLKMSHYSTKYGAYLGRINPGGVEAPEQISNSKTISGTDKLYIVSHGGDNNLAMIGNASKIAGILLNLFSVQELSGRDVVFTACDFGNGTLFRQVIDALAQKKVRSSRFVAPLKQTYVMKNEQSIRVLKENQSEQQNQQAVSSLGSTKKKTLTWQGLPEDITERALEPVGEGWTGFAINASGTVLGLQPEQIRAVAS